MSCNEGQLCKQEFSWLQKKVVSSLRNRVYSRGWFYITYLWCFVPKLVPLHTQPASTAPFHFFWKIWGYLPLAWGQELESR